MNLDERIEALFADPDYGRILASVTGARDARAVSARARELTAALAGDVPRELLFASVSVAAVFGWKLASGERAVLKWLGPGTEVDALAAQYALMDALAEAGVPCPRLVAGPIEAGSGAAVLLSWLPSERATLALDRRCRASAEALARVIRIGRELEVARALPPPDALGVPWPAPHSVVFDFGATAEGAERIDAVGRWTAAELDRFAGELVPAHGDWTAHNVILDEEARLVAIYDWDSVTWEREAIALGAAAVAFALDGRTGGSFQPPEPQASLAFLDAYREVAGQLDARVLRAAKIAAVRTFGYLARCQHAIAIARGHPPYPFVLGLDAYLRALLPGEAGAP